MGVVEATAEVACLQCWTAFTPRPGQFYCSDRCQRKAGDARTRWRRRAGRPPVIPARESCCRNCGGELPPQRLRYCSEICRTLSKHRRQKPPPADLSIPAPCGGCGVLFSRTSAHNRFCSVECRPSWTPPNPRPAPVPRPAPPPPSARSCVTCGRPFLRLDRRGYRNACSYRCELDRQNAKAAEQRRTAGWRERERARRARRQQENDAIFTAVRELGWLDGLLEAVK
jgi:hypothetical protein